MAACSATVPIADQTGDRRMMRGYLDSRAINPTTATIGNLRPGVYDVYVYADGDNGTASRSA